MVPSLSPKKKAHKAVDLKVKLNIIERMRKGARVSSLAKELRLTVSTVSTVWCKWDRYEGPAKTAVDAECLKVVWMRDEKMNKMECASGSRTGFSDISLSARALFHQSPAGHPASLLHYGTSSELILTDLRLGLRPPHTSQHTPRLRGHNPPSYIPYLFAVR
ncbi:hypothetical protein E2C01_086313 [Portunus trituberculatus]|uniref:HTH psq-type domain-containing protein n=1 Tax=Portunus trituberculatus TaxID=210409 RepID=A0A5B7JE93_PORTR|nr:hypothetical protein [Portunus trituberculatus]